MQKDTARIRSLVTMLQRKKLDVLACFHPENVLLASGMMPSAPFTACVATASGRVGLVTPWWSERACRSGSWADEVHVFDWLKGLAEVNPVASVEAFLKTVRKRYRGGRVGYDGSFPCVMPSSIPSSTFLYGELRALLPKVFRKAVDVGAEIHAVRSLKTPREVRMLRRAHGVAREAARAFYAAARAGVREVDVAAEVLRAVQRCAGRGSVGFTYCDPPQISSGARRTKTAYALTCPATARRLKTGELAMLELGGCADGYWFDLTRTLVVGGRPRARQAKIAAAIKEAMDVAFGTYLVGGATGGEIADAAFAVLERHGLGRGIVHGLGHGVGFSYHEDRPGIGPGAKNTILPGMVTSVEPGVYLPGVGGIRIEENVVWGKDTVTILSDYHHGLGPWPG